MCRTAVVLLEFINQSRKCDGGFHSLAVPLQEETSLSLGEFHGLRALFVVVRHVVDSSLGLRQHGIRSPRFHQGNAPTARRGLADRTQGSGRLCLLNNNRMRTREAAARK